MFLSLSQMLAALTITLLVSLGFMSTAARSAEEAEDPLLGFLVGEYIIIGQQPDGGAIYRDSARIELAQGGLMLKRRGTEHETAASGRLEVPSPPGEGRVLRFRWKNPEEIVMTCLIASDLDNYPRLTCIWLREGSHPKQPGLEAMFPTAAWQPVKP